MEQIDDGNNLYIGVIVEGMRKNEVIEKVVKWIGIWTMFLFRGWLEGEIQGFEYI